MSTTTSTKKGSSKMKWTAVKIEKAPKTTLIAPEYVMKTLVAFKDYRPYSLPSLRVDSQTGKKVDMDADELAGQLGRATQYWESLLSIQVRTTKDLQNTSSLSKTDLILNIKITMALHKLAKSFFENFVKTFAGYAKDIPYANWKGISKKFLTYIKDGVTSSGVAEKMDKDVTHFAMLYVCVLAGHYTFDKMRSAYNLDKSTDLESAIHECYQCFRYIDGIIERFITDIFPEIECPSSFIQFDSKSYSQTGKPITFEGMISQAEKNIDPTEDKTKEKYTPQSRKSNIPNVATKGIVKALYYLECALDCLIVGVFKLFEYMNVVAIQGEKFTKGSYAFRALNDDSSMRLIVGLSSICSRRITGVGFSDYELENSQSVALVGLDTFGRSPKFYPYVNGKPRTGAITDAFTPFLKYVTIYNRMVHRLFNCRKDWAHIQSTRQTSFVVSDLIQIALLIRECSEGEISKITGVSMVGGGDSKEVLPHHDEWRAHPKTSSLFNAIRTYMEANPTGLTSARNQSWDLRNWDRMYRLFGSDGLGLFVRTFQPGLRKNLDSWLTKKFDRGASGVKAAQSKYFTLISGFESFDYKKNPTDPQPKVRAGKPWSHPDNPYNEPLLDEKELIKYLDSKTKNSKLNVLEYLKSQLKKDEKLSTTWYDRFVKDVSGTLNGYDKSVFKFLYQLFAYYTIISIKKMSKEFKLKDIVEYMNDPKIVGESRLKSIEGIYKLMSLNELEGKDFRYVASVISGEKPDDDDDDGGDGDGDRTNTTKPKKDTSRQQKASLKRKDVEALIGCAITDTQIRVIRDTYMFGLVRIPNDYVGMAAITNYNPKVCKYVMKYHLEP